MEVQIGRGALATIAIGTILLALIVQTLLKISKLISNANKQKEALKDFDGPTPHWLFGNVHQASGLNVKLRTLMFIVF